MTKEEILTELTNWILNDNQKNLSQAKEQAEKFWEEIVKQDRQRIIKELENYSCSGSKLLPLQEVKRIIQ